MPVIELETRIDAPIDRVFDLARSIDLHIRSTSRTGERAIAGVTTGQPRASARGLRFLHFTVGLRGGGQPLALAKGTLQGAGVTSGLIGPGQEVTWRARHFGIWQSLTVRITAFDRPTHFADTMLRGAFHSMEHHHWFAASGDGVTVMRDVFDFQAPLGILGRAAEALFLTRYMKAFLAERNRVIKAAAESEEWKQYLAARITFP